MAEIKSTLELVMEKTRHLTLSKEEKREQELAELRQRVGGLIQRYLDEALTMQSLQREMEQLQPDNHSEHRLAFLEEAFRRIDLAGNNERLLNLLDQFGMIDTGPLFAILNRYRTTRDDAAREHSQKLKDDLWQRYSIRGSAIVPNLQGDGEWSVKSYRLQADHLSLLEDEFAKLKIAGRG